MNELEQLDNLNLTPEQRAILAEHLAARLPPEERRQAAEVKRAERFRERYWRDPVAFARDNVRWPEPDRWLTGYQQEVLQDLVDHRRLAGAACRGSGKTALASLAILWFAVTRDGDLLRDWKIATTAGSYRQLTEYLWPEIHRWARVLRWDRIGRKPWNSRSELMKFSLDGATGQAFAATSDQPQLIEGAHASQVLFVYDESKSIPPAVFDAIEGTFSNAGTRGREAFILAISTPGAKEGRFWDIFEDKDGAYSHWKTRHVKVDEVLREEMVSRAWVEQRAREWGSDSALYRNQVLGEFASIDEAGIIPPWWIEAAMERSEPEPLAGGMDLASIRG